MRLNYQGLQDTKAWEKAGIALPSYDWKAMCAETETAPTWIHFGAGNIFRGFIAGLQQTLLEKGLVKGGIIAADTFDYDIIDKIYDPHDAMTLMVSLKADGNLEKSVITSIAKGLRAGRAFPEDFQQLAQAFRNPALQMVSFTITEKGYALADLKGNYFPFVQADFENGPENCSHAMCLVTALLHERYLAGGTPVAMVSMDNCSHNGEKLRDSVLTVADQWMNKGFVNKEFVAWISDESKVSFPWSMIDKITPRPAKVVEENLASVGVEGMEPIVTSKNTFIAPFVNAELPQYLVIEDCFPNGRPPLEQAGVYMTDRDTVNDTERMKVTTCLNPLHTALAVFGCLLGYDTIADEMKDAQLKGLVEKMSWDEGMKVVTDPGILSPAAFLKEVLEERLPNPFMPDTPQRIATDTSQKIPIRYGETIKSYVARDDLDVTDLKYIPLTIAGWLRYLLGVDDNGKPFDCSSDPMLEELQNRLQGVSLGKPSTVAGSLEAILSNKVLFGSDLMEIGLGKTIIGYMEDLAAGPGAVRATLEKYVGID